MNTIDLTLTDDEYRLLDYMFRTFDRSDSWIEQHAWGLVADGLEARKLMFRYVTNSGGTMYSISSYGCDAVRAYGVSDKANYLER